MTPARLPARGHGRREPPAGRRSGGFALAAALWILVLVGAVTAGFLTAAQTERRAVANTLESARARWAARAGFSRATAALTRQLGSVGAVRSLRAAGDSLVRAVPIRVNGVPVRTTLLDSRARLNVNRASGADMVELFLALGVTHARAERLADAVLDWRDPDGRTRDGGAEARDYAALGLPVRPRDGPLLSGDELRQVRGFDRGIYRRVRPYVTVVGDGRINVNSAPAPVLSVLPGLDLSSARVLVERRAAGPFGSAFEASRALPDAAARQVRNRMDAFQEQAAFGPRFGQLVVRARPEGTPAQVTIRAVLELQGGSDWRIVRIREE